MTGTQEQNYARNYLRKAEEYLASAQDNVTMERATPTAGDAVHAGISAKDAVVTSLTGRTAKGQDHSTAARELAKALGRRTSAAAAERALRDLLGAKAEIEYGTTLITLSKAEALVRRAEQLVDLAVGVVRLGR